MVDRPSFQLHRSPTGANLILHIYRKSVWIRKQVQKTSQRTLWLVYSPRQVCRIRTDEARRRDTARLERDHVVWGRSKSARVRVRPILDENWVALASC